MMLMCSKQGRGSFTRILADISRAVVGDLIHVQPEPIILDLTIEILHDSSEHDHQAAGAAIAGCNKLIDEG